MDTKNQNYKTVTIFLVEDDDVDVMGIKRALSKLKIVNPLVRARDGLEALEMLRQPGVVNDPYLILLDINMPRMNGIEMLEALRNDPQLSSSVVFVMTTSNDDKDKVNAYKNHVAGYIVKNNVTGGFLEVVELLEHYWRLIEMPVIH